MLCEVLSLFLQRVLHLSCKACVSMTSERQSDVITLSHNYRTLCCCLRI